MITGIAFTLWLCLAQTGAAPAQRRGTVPASRPSQAAAPASRPTPASQPAPAGGSEAQVERAIADLGDPDPEKQDRAIQTVATMTETLRHRLLGLLDHENPRVRVAVLRAFRIQPVKDIDHRVTQAFRDGRTEVREQAVLLYARLAPEDMVENLVTMLGLESEAPVLRHVLLALATAKDHAAITPIIDFLERNADEYLAKRAASALRSLTGEDLGTDVKAWHAWWAEHQELKRERSDDRRDKERESIR